jgi:hypothetical protein
VVIFTFFERKIVANCGHKTKKKDRVRAHNGSTITTLPIKNKKTPYCHRCIEKMAIRCAWCGKVIFIGDPVTLYTKIDGCQIPKHAVFYKQNPIQLVGCLRWGCAETGADRAGFWMPPGKVCRIPTACEMCLLDMQAGGNGVVIVNDLSKP